MHATILTIFWVGIVAFNLQMAYIMQRAHIEGSTHPIANRMHLILRKKWVRILLLVPPMALFLIYASVIAYFVYGAIQYGWKRCKLLFLKYINNK